MAAAKNKKQTGNMDDLKKELDMDYHTIKPEELYKRLQTNLDRVNLLLRVEDQMRKIKIFRD
jgi:hypothetical protein